MTFNHRLLLFIDGIVNLLIGVGLLLFPSGLIEVLGLPSFGSTFYIVILGAVVFGIGIALLIELFGHRAGVRGLGLGGAIAINLCGGLALFFWLVFSSADLPPRGSILLWLATIVVLGIGFAEIAAKSWRYH